MPRPPLAVAPALAFALFSACHDDRTPPAQPAHGPPPPAYGPPATYGPAPPPCSPEGSYSCSPDRAVLLACRGGRFVVASTCRGPRACAEGQAVACDHSTAMPGDPC